ncbi:MAG TPA: HEAT repeat domain-containing protein [Phycisphaerales bacterium]|nr:HEAT repeat domain-containing protein [Phycisphaerales bacterium]
MTKGTTERRTRATVILLVGASVGLAIAGCKGGDGAKGGQVRDGVAGDGGSAPAVAPITPAATTTPAPVAQVNRSAMRERAISILVDAGLSRDPLMRANALEGLIPAPKRLEPMARAAIGDENIGVRYAACIVIGKTKLCDAASNVEPLLRDPDPRVAAGAMYALTRCGRSVNLTPLSRDLQHPDMRVRSEAARVLGEIGNASAAPMLRAAAGRADIGSPLENKLFRLQVAEALVKLGELDMGDTVRAALLPASRNDYECSLLAAQILGELKDHRAVRDLIRVIELREETTGPAAPPNSPRTKAAEGPYVHPKELRLAAAGALGKMGYGDGVYVAIENAGDSDPMIRELCAAVMGAAGNGQTLGELAKLMDDPEARVRLSAAAAALRLLDKAG